MRSPSRVLKLLASLTFCVVVGGQLASARTAPAAAIYLIDPFRLGAADLSNIDLSTILPTITNWPAVTANGLVSDNASAAIVLFQSTTRGEVTFTTDNGSVLIPYAANFLIAGPAAGTPTLTVPRSEFITVGGLHYAAALVEAPSLGDAVHSFSAPITVTAQQRRQTVQTAMSLVPPPIVLVHGLWGDDTSLQNIAGYLAATPPWQGEALISSICYSKYFAFDAATDPLAGDGDPCEVTSQTALTNIIGALEEVLDQAGIVGGRVDIVAHSMGGLAARYYATTADFNNPPARFRNFGAFHQVVTIDTPELGSDLATYVIDNAGRMFAYLQNSLAGFLWSRACDFLDPLATCLAKLGMPLTAPNFPLDQGAVFSLEPGGQAIANLPDAIPNAVVTATAAIWPQQDQPQSLLRNELNLLIRGLYSPSEAAPTTDSILQNEPNDVIVTQTSQVANPGASQSQIFNDLAHTGAALPSLLGPLLGGVDSNVLDSTAVDQTVACLLLSEGDPSCTGSSAPATPQGAARAATNAYQPISSKFLAPERLTLRPGPRKGELGQRLSIPLQISAAGIAAGVTRITLSQADQRGEIHSGSGPAEIKQSGSTNYVEIVPQRLGRIRVTVTIWFGDGGLASSGIDLDVQPPAISPLSFKADTLPVVVITLGSAEPIAKLHPAVTYPDVEGRVPVPAQFLRYRLVPAGGPVPVAVSPNGLIRALQPGTATIEVRFGAAVDRIPVIVK